MLVQLLKKLLDHFYMTVDDYIIHVLLKISIAEAQTEANIIKYF